MSAPDPGFVDTLAQAALLWDADARVAHCSPALAALLGWPAADILGRHVAGLPFIAPADRAAFAAGLAQGAPDVSVRLTTAAGATLATRWHHVPRRAADGTSLGTLSLVAASPAPARSEDDDRIFRALFESVPALCVVLDADDFRIFAASDSYLRMTMRTRDELLGRVFQEAFPDDPANPDAAGTAGFLASVARVKATGATDVMDIVKHPIRTPQGALQDRYWAPLNSPVFGPDGRLRFVIHSTEDVTEFVRANALQEGMNRGEMRVMIRTRELEQLNEQLRESQQRLQAIFHAAPLGIAATDLDGHFTDANATYCRMLGYSLEELKARSVFDITHPDERGHTRELRDSLKRGERDNFVFDKRYLTRTGEQVWCRISASVLRDAGGAVTNLIALTEDITARMRSEAELRQVRALERIGGTIAKVGGWVVEYTAPGGRHIQWSREIFEMFEMDGTEPPRMDVLLELFTPTSGQQLWRALQDCEHIGAAFDLELSLHSFKGTPRWIRIAGEPEFSADGTVARTLGAVQDITRQKAEQLRNQQLSSQLFSTLEGMRDAFYMLDRDGRVLYLNSGAERLLGLNREDTVGRILWESAPWLQRESRIHEGCLRAILTREAFHDEYHSAHLQHWISVSAYPSAEGLAVYFRSTSAEKQLQALIARSEERLKHITQAVLDVVWEIDLEAGHIWVNDGLQRKFGYAVQNQAVDLAFWRERMHPDDRAGIARLRAMLRDTTDTTWSNRYRFCTALGNYVHLEDRGYVMRDESGKAVRVLGGSTDITKRVEMEEQLQQSQRLESIGQLTGGIAHDFNNLLTVILGNVQLLYEELEALPELQQLSRIIEVAATRGATLTRHLLAFSRKQALQPLSIDLDQLITNLRGMLERTLGEHIVIRHQSRPGLWPAFIDPSQLEVALLNLCINSRDAMPDGGIVTIETGNVAVDTLLSLQHSDVQPGDYVLITISDTGRGIAPEILDHVFEPFFTTKEKDKGTGLGLSTVFGFVKQSNGHIHIYSEVGRGTTVRIYLPRSHEQVQAAEPPRRPGTAASGGSETILLVEDNELVRRFGHDLLEALGYTVLAAGEGREALEVLRDNPAVDLLFTDVIMPGMGGRELAEAAMALRPELKVLYASGYTEDAIIHNGKLDKGVHLLEKPYNKSSLANKIRDALDGRVARA